MAAFCSGVSVCKKLVRVAALRPWPEQIGEARAEIAKWSRTSLLAWPPSSRLSSTPTFVSRVLSRVFSQRSMHFALRDEPCATESLLGNVI